VRSSTEMGAPGASHSVLIRKQGPLVKTYAICWIICSDALVPDSRSAWTSLNRWLAEEAAVFTIELRRTFIANLKSGARRIQTVVQHQVSR
jgi:hypothetical protein